MKKIQLECDRKYLLIPIAIEQPLKEIFIYADGKQIYDFKIPVADDEEFYAFQYYAPIPIGEYAGSVVSLERRIRPTHIRRFIFPPIRAGSMIRTVSSIIMESTTSIFSTIPLTPGGKICAGVMR